MKTCLFAGVVAKTAEKNTFVSIIATRSQKLSLAEGIVQ